MRGIKELAKKGVGEMDFNTGGGVINWFPGHMAAATRAIRERLRLADLVLEVRDSRIPLSSAYLDLLPQLSSKRRILVLNKKDLSNSNIIPKWTHYFESRGCDCLAVNSHSRGSVGQLLKLVEVKLREAISKEPTLLVMVVGVPNVGKSVLINSIHQIASSFFPAEGKRKKATVGPLPGVTQDIAGFKISHQPSIYVLDTPGVLVPSIPNIETGLKLALAGSVKDSVVGEERIVKYLLAVLNSRGTPLQWKDGSNMRSSGVRCAFIENEERRLKNRKGKKREPPNESNVTHVRDQVGEVKHALYLTVEDFNGDVENENDLEDLIEQQFEVLQKAMKIPHKASEARLMVSKKFLSLFRVGKLGPFILDDIPDT